MPASLRNCPAPAKLNLFLHVVGRRPDGYHLLQTVFQLLDFGDTLHFELRADEAIRRSTELPGVDPESDLVVRAGRLLREAGQTRSGKALPGVDIAVEKRLPMGGGLGGGSSDAATTLLALNHLWRTGFNRAELMALGLKLGADVPFFLFGRNAFAEGVGEALAAVETPARWFVVIQPGVMVPTAAVFSRPELTRNTKLVKITDFSAEPDGFGRNDLQPVAAALFPAIAEALDWLNAYGNARMTGSGACVFCGFGQEAQAEQVLRAVPPGWRAWKAQALARHPLEKLGFE